MPKNKDIREREMGRTEKEERTTGSMGGSKSKR